MQKLPKVIIYTDGACRPNPGKGGWAAILRFGSSEKVLTGFDANTTSNRMELKAAINAIGILKKICWVDIYVDSNYLRRGITEWITRWRANNWYKSDGQPVDNIDLWQELDQLARLHEVHWHWIKGHAGYPDNELVNKLSRDALDGILSV